MTVLGLVLILCGVVALVVGFVGSIFPALPGPPVAAVGPLLVNGGVWALAGSVGLLSWILVALGLVLGLGATLLELFSPLIAEKIGRTSRGATLGAYYGLVLALLGAGSFGVVGAGASLVTVGLSFVLGTGMALVLILFGPFLGAFVGELAAQPDPEDPAIQQLEEEPWRPEHGVAPLLTRAAISGVAQLASMVLTTGAKLAYCGLAVVLSGIVLFLGVL